MRESARPVASPDDDNVIVSACESRVFNIARNAKLRDKFWIKGQPYSVVDMLGNDPLCEQFEGATVYQAFLSALSYHRWHAPISGRVRRCFVRDGTYFSEPLFESPAEGGDIDTKGISVAQGYISALATRAIIFIEADNPAIGLVAFAAWEWTRSALARSRWRRGSISGRATRSACSTLADRRTVSCFGRASRSAGFPRSGGR